MVKSTKCFQNINLWLNRKIDLLGVILPIGISFYTFQMISYIVDVYRGEVKVQKNFFTLATYVSLFPQLPQVLSCIPSTVHVAAVTVV